jgi:hypothetical protein
VQRAWQKSIGLQLVVAEMYTKAIDSVARQAFISFSHRMANGGGNDGHDNNDSTTITTMKIRFKIDQADRFRRGLDTPKSIISIEVKPADLPQETRDLIARHLEGIDVVEGSGEFYRREQLVMAKDPSLDSLVQRLREIEAQQAEERSELARVFGASQAMHNQDSLYSGEDSED